MKKRWIIGALVLAVTGLIAGCGGAGPNQGSGQTGQKAVLKVGATAVPHGEILKAAQPLLEKEGIKLEIVEFSDYVKPNLALAEKELDANYFQHIPYLKQFAADRKLELVSTAAIHIEPMGVYSKKVKDLKELAFGSQVAIPSDPTNAGRALALLEKAGLIKLKEGLGVKGTVNDVVDNPKKISFKELEAPLLPRALEDVAAAVINTNYALEGKLNPTKDALLLEAGDSPYANVVAVRKGDESRPEIKKLNQVLTSPEIKKFIQDKYQGAVLPAF